MAKGRSRVFNFQALADILWAFVTASNALPERLTRCRGGEGRLRDFNRALATKRRPLLKLAMHRQSLWNDCRSGQKSLVGLQRSRPRRHDMGSCYSRPCIASVLWVIAEVAKRCLKNFISDDLANTVWAFTTAGHAEPELVLTQLQRRRTA